MEAIENSAIQTYTSNSFEEIVRQGGDFDWYLNVNRAKNCQYLVCCSSVGSNRGCNFLVGKINGVELSKLDDKGKKRYVIRISEVATINVSDRWGGYQNPVHYTNLTDMGIDLSALKWQKVATPEQPLPAVLDLTIAQAKAGLANHYGVPESNIEIEIIIKG
jgi:hypothetical protein